MSDASGQLCGNCTLFIEVRKATRNIVAGGKCVWNPPTRRAYNLPMWLANADRYVSANAGERCESWQAK